VAKDATSIDEYVKCCDKCQMRKVKKEFRAPLGEVEDPSEPFQVTSIDITGPYCLTPRKNRYLLTFIDHLTKYVEAFPIPDVSAETCARIYATQIVTRHGSGSTLISDQGRQFTSAFFRETCRILRVKKVRTSAYHAMSNGIVERVHRILHDSIAHYIDSSGTNWDVVLSFFLLAYRATPHCTTGYSPFYLLHGREMVLPNEGDIKAKISPEVQNVDQVQRLENLKYSLLRAYKDVRLNNRKSHQKNKAYYDKKAKERKFEVNDKVLLFSPAKKAGRCHKFRLFWQGPYIVVQKLSDLNYKIVNKKGKEFVVHINRLKKSHDSTPWKFETTRRPRQKTTKLDAGTPDETVEIPPRPIATVEDPETHVVEEQPVDVETPAGERSGRRMPDSSAEDPDYEPPNSAHSRRELATTPIHHP